MEWKDLITGAVYLIAIIITGVFTNRKLLQEMKSESELRDSKLEDTLSKNSELTDMKIKQLSETTNLRIKQLTEETRLHNNFAQKIPLVEQRVGTLETKVEAIEKELHNG